MIPVSAAIFTLLTQNSGVTNIVEDDVQPEHIHQGDRTYPAIVYDVVADKPDHTYSGPSGLETSMVVIVCMSNTSQGGSYTQLQSIKTAVQSAMDGFRGVVNGVVINGCFKEQYREGSFKTAQMAEDDFVYEGEFTFQIVFQNS